MNGLALEIIDGLEAKVAELEDDRDQWRHRAESDLTRLQMAHSAEIETERARVLELEKHNSALKFRVTKLLGVSASGNRLRKEGES